MAEEREKKHRGYCLKCGSNDNWQPMQTIHINNWGVVEAVEVPDYIPKPQKCQVCGSVRTISAFEGWLEEIYVTKTKQLTHLDIYFIREDLGVSHEHLGRVVGVSGQTIRDWENGAKRFSPAEGLVLHAYADVPAFRAFVDQERGFTG